LQNKLKTMAHDKKSFLLYADWIHTVERLNDDEAGQLFKHILRYVNDLNPAPENRVVEISFEPFKQQFKRDLAKWETTREKRSKAGKISAEKRAHQVSTHVEKDEQTATDSTVNGNDTVIVNDKDNVNELEKKNIKLCSLSFKDERLSEYELVTLSFFMLFKSNLISTGITKTTILDKAKLGDWTAHVKRMYEVDRRTDNEVRMVYDFLKVNEFWKKNIQSTKTLREKFEKLFLEINSNKPTQKQNENEVQDGIRAQLENEGLISSKGSN